jgi:hypothetical protein
LFDPNEPNLDVDLSDGRRPASSTGDRLMVGLATIALLGGALIAITRLLPSDGTEASLASRTPAASVVPTPTVRPTPRPILEAPLRTFRINEEPLPEAEPTPFLWSGWARATRRIKVRATPSTDAPTLTTLHAGDALWVQEQAPGTVSAAEGWLEADLPATGWIQGNTGPDGNLLRFDDAQPDGASILSIAAGIDGRFVALGSRWRDGAYFVAVNAGGGRWQAVETPGMVDNASEFRAAYGPRGWIALATVNASTGPKPWVWQSDDGVVWRALGGLRDLPYGGIGPIHLTGSPLGYVMTSFYAGYEQLPKRVWYSADGEVWSERETPIGPNQLVASGIGFYAYTSETSPYAQSDSEQGAFSPNGWDWTAVDTSDMDELLGVAGAEDRLVALDHVGDDIHTWIGQVEGDELVWRHELTSEGAFENAVVTDMRGDVAPIAVGYERGTETALWWSNDEAGWHRHRLPASFGVIPTLGAAGERGYVVVGAHRSVLGHTPLLWSAEGSTSLQPERDPTVRPIPDPGPEACADVSRDLLEFINYGLIQAHCYGDAPLTLTAYVPRCGGCEEPPHSSIYRPEWLNNPAGDRILRLAPVAVDDWSWLDAILAPGLKPHATWAHHWVQVTGHFDDPAAQNCRMRPGPDDERWYAGRQEVIDGCRQRFVVTSVTVLREG